MSRLLRIPYKEHIAQLIKAIEAEKLQEQKYYEQVVNNQPLSKQVEEGMAMFPLRYEKHYFTVGDMVEITLERSGNLETKHKVRVGSGIQIATKENNDTLYGMVSYMRKSIVKILVNDAIFDAQFMRSGKAFAVRLTYDDRPYRVMLDSMNAVLEKANTPELKPYIDAIYKGEIYNETRKQNIIVKPSMNASQKEAIELALAAFPYHIIHGPPGTGKTTTLIELIRHIASREQKVLVCAASNNAVDLLAERCNMEGLIVTRVGNIARISDDLVHLSLGEKVRNHKDWEHVKKVKIEAQEARRQAKKFKRNFGPEERQQRKMLMNEWRELKTWAKDLEFRLVNKVLEESQVIATTLIGSEHSSIADLKYHTVIIDEASQALTPECWAVMLKAKRVILAGDHQQLPPTVKSDEAIKLGLQTTLFEDLIVGDTNQSLLDTQYRMNDAILSFSNREFYDGKLKSAEKVANHTLINDAKPLVFIDTAGTGYEEDFNPQRKSYKNPGEFTVVREHIISMRERLLGASIGIISPYKEQVRYIQNTIVDIEALRGLDIQIDSIDGFQGQEKDVIYISLVRSNERGNIGFLEDYRRLNVALTRARKKLIIIGDSSTIGRSKLYDNLINHVESRGEIKSAWEYMEY